MKKIGFVLMPAFVLALALSAAAQATGGQEKPLTTDKMMDQTVKVTVTGRVVLDMVWRSAGVTFGTEGFSPSPAPPGLPVDHSDSENTFEGYVAVAFNVDLSDKISVVVEIGNTRIEGNSINEWGNTSAEVIRLREAHINIAELFTPETKAQVGISTWDFDIRGKGSSFAFDPRHSASITKNHDHDADEIGDIASRTGMPGELNPVGGSFCYSREAITVGLVLLPAVIEGGNPSVDESLYAVWFMYNLDQVGKGSRVGAILAVSAFELTTRPDPSGVDTSLWTFGFGADLNNVGMQGLEIYGEFYFQFGNAGQIDVSGTADQEDIDADGYAFQIGGVYTHMVANPMPVWVGLNFTYVSGDDDEIVGPGATDDTNSKFLSYENINDLLVLEDMYYGFDWDTNYLAFKISGGTTMSVGSGKDNLELSLIIGIARTAEDVRYSVGGVQVATEDKLGNEVDFRAKYLLNKQVSVHAALGFLFGSDVLEESMRRSGDTDEEDSAQVFVVGTDLRF